MQIYQSLWYSSHSSRQVSGCEDAMGSQQDDPMLLRRQDSKKIIEKKSAFGADRTISTWRINIIICTNFWSLVHVLREKKKKKKRNIRKKKSVNNLNFPQIILS